MTWNSAVILSALIQHCACNVPDSNVGENHHQDSNVGEITIWWEKKKTDKYTKKREGSPAFQNFYSIVYSRQYFEHFAYLVCK